MLSIAQHIKIKEFVLVLVYHFHKMEQVEK